MQTNITSKSAGSPRRIKLAKSGTPVLGPLKLLPGTWANIRPEHRLKTQEEPNGDAFQGEGTLTGEGLSPFDGRGWNLIALPFFEPGQFRNYRLLMNQYNEVLSFKFIDDDVPNRGIKRTPTVDNADQLVVALDYTQMIKQIAAADRSESGGKAGFAGLPIHHEPGFFLHMRDQRTQVASGQEIDIARLAVIPHGNSATALGTSSTKNGPPVIPELGGFPEGVSNDIIQAVAAATGATDYLGPYNFFSNNPFKGVITSPGFPGFKPQDATELLRLGMPQNVLRTTVLPFDTTVLEAGIVNIPFIERQADAATMSATFWLMELDEVDEHGDQRLVLAYAQFIFLDFFERRDGRAGLIRWPHISINMMEKISEPEALQASPEALAL